MNRRIFTFRSTLTVGIALFGAHAADWRTDKASALRELLSVPDDAVAVGSRFLQLYPSYADRETLWRYLGVPAEFSGSKASLAQRMVEQRDLDYRQGNLVVIDGWVVARCEAAVCALLALS